METTADPPINFPTKTLLSVILIVIMTGTSITAAYFFITYQSLSKDFNSTKEALSKTQEKNTQLDKDLIFYKNTDLAKEVELLKTKLNISQRDLAQKEQDLASANNRLKTIDANRGKIKLHLDAIEAVSSNYWHYTLTEPILDGIEAKVKALGDSEILSLWIVARKQTTPNSANPSAVWDVVSRMLANVRSLLP